MLCGFYRPRRGTVRLGDTRSRRPARAPDRARRHRAHLPDPAAVRRHDGAREPAGRRAGAGSSGRRLVRRAELDPAQKRRRRARCLHYVGYTRRRAAPRRRPAARRPAPARDRPRPGARARACCCSTSRPPVSTAPTRSARRAAARIADAGVAVVLVEHDMTLVMGISDHVVVLDAGQRIAGGAPDAVRSDPAVHRGLSRRRRLRRPAARRRAHRGRRLLDVAQLPPATARRPVLQGHRRCTRAAASWSRCSAPMAPASRR